MEPRPARIDWLPRSQGGRMVPPSGPRYVAPVKFGAEGVPWPDEAWSLVVELSDRLEGNDSWLAHVHFLADGAPHRRLVEGADFGLYEGNRCVARGQILGDRLEAHPQLTSRDAGRAD